VSFTDAPSTIADNMEEWLFAGACDGFNAMLPSVPSGLDDFVDMVVSELQRRGLFRTACEGRTSGEAWIAKARQPVLSCDLKTRVWERGDMSDISASIEIRIRSLNACRRNAA